MITVNGTPLPWREGMTVSEVLARMDYTAINLITVFVDGVHVPESDYDAHVVKDGADVRAVHIHHGG